MPRGRKKTLEDSRKEAEAEGAFAEDLNAMRKADDEDDEPEFKLDKWQERKRKQRLKRDQPQLENLRKKGIIPNDYLRP